MTLLTPLPASRGKARAKTRRLLLLLTGLTILVAVAIFGATPENATAQQGFSKPDQSHSVLPDTVTLRTRI